MTWSKKFIAWDWNGTLLDDAQLVLESANVMQKHLNIPQMDMETFRRVHLMPLKAFYIAMGVTENRYEEARQIFFDHYEPLVDTVPLRTGATDVLRHIKKFPITNVIVSNHVIHHIDALLQRHNVRAYFEDIVAFTGYGKEHRQHSKGEKLQHYVQRKSLNYADMMIVGDTLEEIELAKDLGMISVAITGGSYAEDRLRAMKPDYVIHTLHELEPILLERGFTS